MNEVASTQGSYLNPSNFQEAWEMSEFMAKSSMVPNSYQGKPADILIAMQMGYEVGLKPIQALQNISVINGRPSIWGDGLRALIMSASDLINIEEEFNDGTQTARCVIVRRINGNDITFCGEFSKADAEKAGLWGRNTWKSYPKRMLEWRAFGFAARNAYADRLRGIQLAEESQDIPTQERNMGSAQIEEVPEEPDADLERYSESEFQKNLPTWSELIESGKTSPDHIISMISSKFKLSEDHIEEIKGLAQ
ncbi:hypothetical protein [Sessilibacter corallicola]|uniref:hypothetical protein n=1 Tax=Sessilibacter corallicola TaxID=2904075 RepID=UPI001E4332FB|nr:hypothetical protein [Sessilibacter corallicola]MCE2029247.1 hypothetical protein [Sessilibacter corallicola]